MTSKNTPLDVLLEIMRDRSVPTQMRLRAAELAAPYLHKPVSPALPKENEQ